MNNVIVNVPCIAEPIRACPGFEKKRLATDKLDLMALCAYGCRFCSTPHGNYLRVHRTEFADLTEQQTGHRMMPAETPALSFRWPDVLERLEAQLASKRKGWGRGRTLIFSMLTDAFSPWAVDSGLTRAALDQVLERTAFRIRVLTKSAIVGQQPWLDLFRQHHDRVVVGLSIGTLDDEWARRMEPGTSEPSARIRAIHTLQDVGVPSFGMLCPAFPEVLEGDGLERLVVAIRSGRMEHIWAEPFNERRNWQQVRAAYPEGSTEYRWFTQVYEEGRKDLWSRYGADLYLRLRGKAAGDGWLHKLRYLLYEGDIAAADARSFEGMEGVLLQATKAADGRSPNPAMARIEAQVGTLM